VKLVHLLFIFLEGWKFCRKGLISIVSSKLVVSCFSVEVSHKPLIIL